MDENKKRALSAALSQIEKQFGKGSVIRMGDRASEVVPVIPTGSLQLDLALGIGGLPRGRVIEVYGPESSGKTTLTLQTIAQCQKMGGVAAFIDAEHALDPIYAAKLGVNVDDLLVRQTVPDTVTCKYEEFLLTGSSVGHNFGFGSDDLLLCRESSALLELKVTDSTAQRKVTVNTVNLDKAASVKDTRVFSRISWLVVKRKRLRFALEAKDGARVTRIRHDNAAVGRSGLRNNECRYSCATGRVIGIHGVCQRLLTYAQVFISLDECAAKRRFVLAVFELWELGQTSVQGATRVACNIRAWSEKNAPPWPSYTPKKLMSLLESGASLLLRLRIAACASSIEIRQPCMSDTQ